MSTLPAYINVWARFIIQLLINTSPPGLPLAPLIGQVEVICMLRVFLFRKALCSRFRWVRYWHAHRIVFLLGRLCFFDPFGGTSGVADGAEPAFELEFWELRSFHWFQLHLQFSCWSHFICLSWLLRVRCRKNFPETEVPASPSLLGLMCFDNLKSRNGP